MALGFRTIHGITRKRHYSRASKNHEGWMVASMGQANLPVVKGRRVRTRDNGYVDSLVP